MPYCHNTALLNAHLRRQDEEEERLDAISARVEQLLDGMSAHGLLDLLPSQKSEEILEILSDLAEDQLKEEAESDFDEPEPLY